MCRAIAQTQTVTYGQKVKVWLQRASPQITFYHLDQIRSLIDLNLFMWMNGTSNMDFADPLWAAKDEHERPTPSLGFYVVQSRGKLGTMCTRLCPIPSNTHSPTHTCPTYTKHTHPPHDHTVITAQYLTSWLLLHTYQSAVVGFLKANLFPLKNCRLGLSLAERALV